MDDTFATVSLQKVPARNTRHHSSMHDAEQRRGSQKDIRTEGGIKNNDLVVLADPGIRMSTKLSGSAQKSMLLTQKSPNKDTNNKLRASMNLGLDTSKRNLNMTTYKTTF